MVAILDDQEDVTSTLSYYPGVDKPHSLMTSAETYYYATDPTGSVSGLAEFTGAASVAHHYRYDVWGKRQGSFTEGVDNPLRFKARWLDNTTGLVDFRARWYDPDIGRFISEDPIGLAGGINVYRFVGNDPVGGSDPTGLADCEDGEEEVTVIITQFDESGFPINQEQVTYCVATGDGEGVNTSELTTGAPPLIGPNPMAAFGFLGRGYRFVQGLVRSGGSLGLAIAAARMPSQFGLAARVARATGGTLSRAQGAGFTVNIPYGARDLILRVMAQSSSRQNYWRMSVAGKQAFTRQGAASSDGALTHIPITRSSFDDIIRIVERVTQ